MSNATWLRRYADYVLAKERDELGNFGDVLISTSSVDNLRAAADELESTSSKLDAQQSRADIEQGRAAELQSRLDNELMRAEETSKLLDRLETERDSLASRLDAAENRLKFYEAYLDPDVVAAAKETLVERGAPIVPMEKLEQSFTTALGGENQVLKHLSKKSE